MYKGQQEKRKEYINHINLTYGIKIEEFRQPGQKCGYFHITFPVFDTKKQPGIEPLFFAEPITVYMECNLHKAVNDALREGNYKDYCIEWRNNHPIIEELQEFTHIEGDKGWED